MPVAVSWFLDQRVLMCRFQAVVTVDELGALAREGVARMDGCPYPLMHSLYDAADLQSLPLDLKTIADAARRPYNHPRLGWIAVYNVNAPLLGFIGNMILQLFHVHYHIFDTQDEAVDFLNEIDPTLPPLLPLLDAQEAVSG